MDVVARLAGVLAAHRTAVYIGGLGVIAGARYRPGPLAGTLDRTAATGLVAAALALMVATYLAELGVGSEPAGDTRTTSTRARVLVAAGLAGFAVGGAFALDGEPLVGGPFLVGAVLLVRAGVRRRPAAAGEAGR